MVYTSYQKISQKIAFICATTYAFFIIFGPALTNLFLFLTFLFILLSGNIKQHIINVWNNKVAKASIFLFFLLLVGTIWSIAETNDAFRVLKKYLPLLYIALLMPLFDTQNKQNIGINVFLLSTSIVLFIIYLMHFKLIPEFDVPIPGRHRPLNVTIDGGFQTHIITNILMAFAAFIFLIRCRTRSGIISLLNVSLFVITSYYVLLISHGTSGQILLLTLIFVFVIQTLSKKWIIIFSTLSLLALSVGLNNLHTLKTIHPNVQKTIDKLIYKHEQLYESSTPKNVNQRPQRYLNSIKMITSDPWLGSGTGSYYAAYKSKLPEIEKITTGTKWNPHNEYLSIGVQLGVVGIIFLLFIFYTQLKEANKKEDLEIKLISQGFIALMVIGCIANSMIMDSGESHFFAYFSALLFYHSNIDFDNNENSI